MSARFVVATCEGYRITGMGRGKHGSRAVVGLSATVCDTLNLYREVKTYRSEDRHPLPENYNATRGKDGALVAARDHARYLNRLYADG